MDTTALFTDRLPLLASALLATALAWELLRHSVVGTIRQLLQTSARRHVERHGIQVDLFKFSGRQFVKAQLFNDLAIQEAIVAAARAGEPPERARARVEEYVDEIIPRFSMTAYFKFGSAVARTVLRLLYRLEPDRESYARIQDLPANASVMFLMNHRSNADYLLVAVSLARRVAISFAIGEWARVFPLDLLFRLFGGYFLRRNFRDPLYQTVLRRYLQLIVRHGVTQGLFPEGRLSRDGRLGEPKIGLLDAMVSMAAEPGFDREIVFVPVGINFDRVLEDNFLVVEQDRSGPPTRAEKLASTARLASRVPGALARNVGRILTGRLHRFGHASVSFGNPVFLSQWAEQHGTTAAGLAGLPKEERRPLVKQLADDVMEIIGRAVPATPVPLTCRALHELGGEASKHDLERRVNELARRCREAGTPVVFGRELVRFANEKRRLEEQTVAEDRRRELAEVDAAFVDLEGAEECTRIGLNRLLARRLVTFESGRIRVEPGREALIRYYGNSLSVLDAPSAASHAA